MARLEEEELTEKIIGACFEVSNYLKAIKMKIGLLVNFGKPKVEWKRFVN